MMDVSLLCVNEYNDSYLTSNDGFIVNGTADDGEFRYSIARAFGAVFVIV